MSDFPPYAGIYEGDAIADRTRGEVRELRAEIERLRAALREALEKATGCAPADRLHELEPLWAVLDGDKELIGLAECSAAGQPPA